ncbi:hypothetical protein [Streptomyces sp. NPDC048659]|uniref:hypothetical protein n=1 Tax=Streptomyces sp. NPDC048659 TaxID=3155489 RepID=UPI003445F1C7
MRGGVLGVLRAGRLQSGRVGELLDLRAWIDAVEASRLPGLTASHSACSETSTP